MKSKFYYYNYKKLKNFLNYRYGFVPNGGRIYFLKRSQPPMLILMFIEYLKKATIDIKFIEKTIPILEKELNFWDNRRQITIKDIENPKIKHQVYQYYAESNEPRPESYRKDIKVTENVTEEKKPLIYQVKFLSDNRDLIILFKFILNFYLIFTYS